MKSLAEMIASHMKDDFRNVFLSGNLRDTIYTEPTPGGYNVYVPAERYDLTKWSKDGVVVYLGEGSYAQQVNKTGGFSGRHKGYVDRGIENAINQWAMINGYKVRVTYE